MSGIFSPNPQPPLATSSQHGLLSATDKTKLDALYQATPSCRAYHLLNQSIATATMTALALNAERFDTHAFHDTTTNNSRLTVPAGLGGLYSIAGSVEWAVSGVGTRILDLRLNGTLVLARHRYDTAVASNDTEVVAVLYRLAAGDYVELCVYQSSGGALLINAVSAYTPECALARLGD